MNEEAIKYLYSRGYEAVDLEKEEITYLGNGRIQIDSLSIETLDPRIAWVCRTPSNSLMGVISRSLKEKRYIWYQGPKPWLPTYYSSREDRELFLETGVLNLVEGVFDRIAVKKARPKEACYARLTKGMSQSLKYHLKRHCKDLRIIYDEDEPGRDGAIRTENMLRSFMETTQVRLDRKDPGKVLEDLGVEALAGMIEDAIF